MLKIYNFCIIFNTKYLYEIQILDTKSLRITRYPTHPLCHPYSPSVKCFVHAPYLTVEMIIDDNSRDHFYQAKNNDDNVL